MSVTVELERLQQEVAGRVATPFLVTTGPDGRPHTVSIALGWDGEQLVGGIGRSTARNAGGQPAVCLLWPPDAPGEYSLICDATAVVHGEPDDADGQHVRLTPVKSVLHRPAEQSGQTSAETCCRHDCKPVLGS